MLRRLKTQSILCVRDGPRRTFPSEVFNETKRGTGRFVTLPLRSCADATVTANKVADRIPNPKDAIFVFISQACAAIFQFVGPIVREVLVPWSDIRHHAIKSRQPPSAKGIKCQRIG